MRRKGSEEERWDWEEFNSFEGVPWKPNPNSESIEIKSRVIMPREEIVRAGTGEETVIQVRRPQIRTEDIRRLGMTQGCIACRMINAGSRRGENHSKECRKRFEELMKDAASVKNAKERKQDFEKFCESSENFGTLLKSSEKFETVLKNS